MRNNINRLPLTVYHAFTVIGLPLNIVSDRYFENGKRKTENRFTRGKAV
jgi:hypothetical protein